MSEEIQVEREGRPLMQMVGEELDEEGYRLQDLIGLELYSMDGETTYSGLLITDGDDYEIFEVSVGREDLPVEDVRSYLDQFYTDQERLRLHGTKGTRGLYEVSKWTEEDGTPQSFIASFDADPVRQEVPKTGELSMGISLYDSWENPKEKSLDSMRMVNSTVQKMDRPELSDERMEEYWSTELLDYGGITPKILDLFINGSDVPWQNLENLSNIEFEDREDVKPTKDELLEAYQHLRNNGWQPTIVSTQDFRATDNSLTAYGSEEEFQEQLDWIEDRFGIKGEEQQFTMKLD